MEAGASPNASVSEPWLPMALDCIQGHDDIVRLLIEYGVDLSLTQGWFWDDCAQPEDDYYCDSSPLILAAGCGHESIVRILISYGVNPDIRSPR